VSKHPYGTLPDEMSDRARPRSMEGVRLVEEGREKEKPLKRLAYVKCREFVDLANELAALEAVDEDRQKLAVVGSVVKDGAPFGGDRPELSGEYPGSHNLLTGASARQTDIVLFARRMLKLIEEEAGKLCR